MKRSVGRQDASPWWLRRLEFVLIAGGIGLLCLVGGTVLLGRVQSKLAMTTFRDRLSGAPPDTSLWSPERVKAYLASRKERSGEALAVLHIPQIKLEVPVFEGTSELNLNRGVGYIEGTARPDKPGNVGIAGHRDGFFRGLKDIALGDLLELETGTGRMTYTVKSITIVAPEDVHVLDPSAEPVLTLVTCYPFYFVGDAPQRFIVRAVLSESPAAQTP
ncbi:MAG: class D sortase [Acidobacteria bacterium]|nr:class D sortase [Acidobacteriota bacterium]MCK6685744.1 class D sortase [Thermoanaerobaculia bacterium]